MLDAIRSRDFTLRYAVEHLHGEERLLAESINAVISEFREIQTRQAAQYGQYETLLNQVNAALIASDERGHVKWMNQRAINDLCGFRIEHLDMLASVNKSLPAVMGELKAGEQRLVRMRINDRDVEWSIHMATYFSLGEQVRLFSIENMQGVLMQKEVESQRRLVSVLTHEIMNSLAPIISLSETLLDSVTPPKPSPEAEGTALSLPTGEACQSTSRNSDETTHSPTEEGCDCVSDSFYLGLSAIHRRSEGLLHFVENYRKLSRIPAPQKAPVVIGDLIADIQHLFTSPHIIYDVEDATEEIDIDRHQIEQVLINLLKNAEEAIAGIDATADGGAPSPRIVLSTHANRASRRFFITVEDNGMGIAPEALDCIFVPFFTTKQGGSGIGLSISRQIVVQHGGTICVSSKPGHTVFTVEV